MSKKAELDKAGVGWWGSGFKLMVLKSPHFVANYLWQKNMPRIKRPQTCCIFFVALQGATGIIPHFGLVLNHFLYSLLASMKFSI